ncbi:DUF1080 domain-containing protein [Clostridium aestuarii]|uniref:DUF1080 domain-containing protein n=1 Tax=Clostridium aestuarii TaxID=338193 RepID=A0ABT4CX87_9CLOT|nr:family 16 glycoside hydrolase [Clostridium aestuarii]MCY6482962.1 DUF1080 domain-containing protein [Clostridium aestuarii]
MLKKRKGSIALGLVLTMFFSLAPTSYAFAWNPIKKAKNWTKGAVKDVKDATKDASEAVKDAAEDVADDVSKAAKDAAKDVGKWGKGATKDISKWSKGAIKDVGKWGKGAIKDIGDFTKDNFSGNKTQSELAALPVLNLDESQMLNVFNPGYGSFTYLDNVKEKKLSPSAYIKLENELKKSDLSENIIDFILETVSGVDGDNIGGAVADLFPGSFLYRNAVAKVLNNVISNKDFVNINPYTDAIKSKNCLEGFSAHYDIPIDKNSNLQSNLLLVVTGVKYGSRDDFKIAVSTITKNGKETKVPVVKKALNGKEIAFEAKLNGIDNNIDKIRISYNNKFNKPNDPVRLIANGIQDAINGAIPIGNPISNDTRDKIIKVLNKHALDKFGGEHDTSAITTEYIIGEIPYVGTAIQAIGGTNWLTKQIRKIKGKIQVKSYAEISDAKILVKKYNSASELNNSVNNATDTNTNTILKTTAYDFSSNTPKIKCFGETWFNNSTRNEGQLVCQTPVNGHGLAIIDENNYSDFAAETMISVSGTGNAGLEFRINNVIANKNQFQGYMAGITAGNNGTGEVFLGRHNFGWKQIKNVKTTIAQGKEYKLKVVAVGTTIQVYLNDKLMINVNDDSYRDGYIGYHVWNTKVTFDNLVIAEQTAVDNIEYNFSSNKPSMEYYSGNWDYYESTSSTQLRCITGNKTNSLSTLEDNTYSDFLASTTVTTLDKNGNAGLEFRINNIKAPNNQFQGYLAAIKIGDNGKGQIFLGKTDYGWKRIKTVNTTITQGLQYKLTVLAIGNNIKVYLNGNLMIDVNDSSFANGSIGYDAYNNIAFFDNLEITPIKK